MDAVPFRRWLGVASLVAFASVGCAAGPLAQLIPRGQAPDEPKAPLGKIVITESLPDPLAPPAAPKSPILPASANGPARNLSSLSSPLRDTQIKVAAFIGIEVVITDDEVWQMVRQRAPEYMEMFGAEQVAKEKTVYREELRKLIERELIVLELFSRMKKNKAEDKIEGLHDHAREQATRRLNEYRKARKVDEANFWTPVDRLDFEGGPYLAKIQARVKDYEARFANPFVAAERGYLDEVIMPHGTRKRIARALNMLRNKELQNPWKKHDNIPL